MKRLLLAGALLGVGAALLLASGGGSLLGPYVLDYATANTWVKLDSSKKLQSATQGVDFVQGAGNSFLGSVCVGTGPGNCTFTNLDAAYVVGGEPLASTTTLTYGSTTNINFNTNLQTVSLTGNITFTTSNLVTGRAAAVRVISDGSTRTFTFPAGWTFIGAAAPANIAASKTGILSLTSFGTTDAGVVAAYAVQP